MNVYFLHKNILTWIELTSLLCCLEAIITKISRSLKVYVLEFEQVFFFYRWRVDTGWCCWAIHYFYCEPCLTQIHVQWSRRRFLHHRTTPWGNNHTKVVHIWFWIYYPKYLHIGKYKLCTRFVLCWFWLGLVPVIYKQVPYTYIFVTG